MRFCATTAGSAFLRDEVSRWGAAALIGLPVWLAHWWWAQRLADSSIDERASAFLRPWPSVLLFLGEKRRFALLGVYGQSIFVDPELKLVMVITAAAKNASVGKESFARERSALWRGIVTKYGSW
jgi:CubicO group peptidase (beta-lactamase class C family)